MDTLAFSVYRSKILMGMEKYLLYTLLHHIQCWVQLHCPRVFTCLFLWYKGVGSTSILLSKSATSSASGYGLDEGSSRGCSKLYSRSVYFLHPAAATDGRLCFVFAPLLNLKLKSLEFNLICGAERLQALNSHSVSMLTCCLGICLATFNRQVFSIH